MGKIQPLMASVIAPGAAEKDAVAYVAFLDAQKEVNKGKKIGTQTALQGVHRGTAQLTFVPTDPRSSLPRWGSRPGWRFQ